MDMIQHPSYEIEASLSHAFDKFSSIIAHYTLRWTFTNFLYLRDIFYSHYYSGS